MDVPSETTAALDMLRAARSYVTSHTLRRQVMITAKSPPPTPTAIVGHPPLSQASDQG
jgi:hypothetical protein